MTVTEKLNGYGPLAGIKVVEMCTYVAAPATVRVLSEMGAEVIKIESFAGDTQRTQGPGFGCELTDTEDPTIDLNNTNKNWVSLNLKDPEGLAIAKKMIGEADIFMNNMRTAAPEEARTRLRDPARGVPGADLGPDARLRRVRRVRPCPRLRCRVLGRPRRRGRYLPREEHLPRHPPAGLR